MQQQIASSKEDAIERGVSFYYRDKPCIKCGDNVFYIIKKEAGWDRCYYCIKMLSIKNKRQQKNYENYLCKL